MHTIAAQNIATETRR